MSPQVVKDHGSLGEEEWSRIERDPHHNLEWLTHTRFPNRHLPETGTVLDAGGGPGRHAILLAGKGFRVVLFDVSRAGFLRSGHLAALDAEP
jgi:SAM-dependent methyltransferase